MFTPRASQISLTKLDGLSVNTAPVKFSTEPAIKFCLDFQVGIFERLRVQFPYGWLGFV